MHWEGDLRALAAGQDGVVGRHQVRELGYDRRHWYSAQRSGRWQQVSQRVLMLAGSPPTERQRVRAAILDAGEDAVLHGPTALAWLGLRGFSLAEIHVARPRCDQLIRSDLAQLHLLRDLRRQDRCVVHGIPSVTALRAVWSEASRFASERLHEVGVRRIGRILDDAHVAGLVTWEDLHHSVDDLQCRGRAGTVVMRELAAGRPIGSSPTESRLEDRFEEVLGPSKRRFLTRQRVVGESRPIGRVDYRDIELPLVVEVNSLAFHSAPSDQAADEERYGDLTAAGFTVAVVWESDLWSRHGNVVDTFDSARREAKARSAKILHSAGCPWPSAPDRLVIHANGPKLRG